MNYLGLLHCYFCHCRYIFLTALLLTSGGVESGRGYLLVFTVAFGGIMVREQLSILFAAIATVCGISAEYYLHNTGAVSGSQHYSEMAMLGVSFFLSTTFSSTQQNLWTCEISR